MSYKPVRKVGERYQYGDYNIILEKDDNSTWTYKIQNSHSDIVDSGGRYEWRSETLEKAKTAIERQAKFQEGDIIRQNNSNTYYKVFTVGDNKYTLKKLNCKNSFEDRVFGVINCTCDLIASPQ